MPRIQPTLTHCPPRRAASSGFTLVELLIVVAVMAIVTAIVLPQLEPNVTVQLEAIGSVVISDLDYARQLSVANQTSYVVDFATTNDRYTISHSGSNPSFNTLPASPFRHPGDPPGQHICRFADLPQAGMQVVFLGISPPDTDTSTQQLEFGPLGELTQSVTSTIWLAAGTRQTRFYLPILVNGVTGLATLGEMTSANPFAGGSIDGSKVVGDQ